MERKSYAKINLTLDITGLMENGYHSLRMIMHSVNLYDTITIKESDTRNIELHTNYSFIPTNEKNHAFRAAKLFFEYTGIQNKGIVIDIKKRIPVSAGLAGGSSNAATVLKMLNDFHHTKLSKEQLCEIGCSIGADVPYCIHGGTMLAEGIGEILTPISSMPSIPIVLVKPNFGVSTPESFRHWDLLKSPVHPDTDKMLTALQNKNKEEIGKYLCNTLEFATFDLIGQARDNPIPKIKETMLDCGAYGALMSGSGPTVFGLFPSEQAANNAAKKLKTSSNKVYVTTT